MDIYDKSPDWKQNSLIVSLLIIFCFPLGLYLMWNHPTWEKRTKWIITGIFLFFGVVNVLGLMAVKASIARKIAQADAYWTADKQADAVTIYKTIEDKDWSLIDDAAKPVLISRIVEFHADAGQDDEANKWIAKAKIRGVSLTSSSPKVTSLLAIEEQKSKTEKSAKSESSTSKQDTGYELGKEFTLGDYKYKIISLERQSQIGEELFGNFTGEKASPGASFVVVTYTIENITNESQVVMADDFKLLDVKGRTFDTSSDVSTALLMSSEDKDFLLSELQPGIPRRMQQGFELPDKALESDLTLIVPKKGLFSSGDARLTVRPVK